MADIKFLNVDALGKPLGQYSHVTRVKASEFLFIAGQVGAGADGKAVGGFDAQCGQAFANLDAALKSQGASWAQSRRVHDLSRALAGHSRIHEFRLREFPRMFPSGSYPPNTLLMIDRLVKEEFLIEVSAVAAL